MKKHRLLSTCLFIALSLSFFKTSAQDPGRYNDAVNNIKLKYSNTNLADSLIVFTGSSSIRMWENVNDYFPDKNIINTGFGGSEMSDLLYFVHDLVIDFNPYVVYIYEGDNDIASGKIPSQIIETTDSLIKLLKTSLPGIQIRFISAKPSILRWNLKEQYLELNKLLKEDCLKYDDVEFINVWNIMLDKEGNIRKDIFIEDGLHMNTAGYDLWAEEIEKYINN